VSSHPFNVILFTCDTEHGLVIGMDVLGVSHHFYLSRNFILKGLTWWSDIWSI